MSFRLPVFAQEDPPTEVDIKDDEEEDEEEDEDEDDDDEDDDEDETEESEEVLPVEDSVLFPPQINSFRGGRTKRKEESSKI